MSRVAYATELERLADQISDASRADLQIVLRRAALRLRNASAVALEPEWEEALETVAAEQGIGRNELIREIVKDWLKGQAYLPLNMVEGLDTGESE